MVSPRLTDPRQIEGPPTPPAPRGKHLMTPLRSVRRIIVRPEDVFQNEPGRPTRLSLEAIVVRYILLSALAVALVVAVGLIALYLLRS